MDHQSGTYKLLIIGGSGFLSGTLARRAVARGYRVWTITRGQRSVPEGVISLIADRHDLKAFANAVRSSPITWNLVIDCIAFHPEDILQDIRLFRSCAEHLIFVSTDFVYDPHHRQYPQGEETDNYAKEGYGFLKRLCELELIKAEGSLPWTVVRPCHIYGPGSELGCLPGHSRDPMLINRMRVGETLNLAGGGHFLQQPILVRDLADLLLDMGGNENTFHQVLNAAGPDVIESRTYYQIIADILGVELYVDDVPVSAYLAENPALKNFLCHRFYDLQKLPESGLSVPKTSLEEGLREHVESLL